MTAPRPGLIAKKISVRSKLNKRHMRTYWVRPEMGAIVRLRRARAAGEHSEGWTPQEEHPREQIKAWFASRGHAISDRDAKNLIKIFQPPSGRMVTAADFDRLFANPGKMTFPMMEETGAQTPWRTSIAKPVKDSAGNVKMASYDIRIDFSSVDVSSSGNHVGLKMKIIGTPIHPPDHPDAGKPTGAGDVLMSRGFDRGYSRRAEGVHVEHDFFVMEPKHQGSGLGATVIENQFMTYESLGVKSVHVHGLWMGQYYWGRIGFEEGSSARSASQAHFAEKMEILVAGASNAVRNCSNTKENIAAGYPKRKPPIKWDGTPYTKEELIALHTYNRPDGTTLTTSQLYAMEVEVLENGVKTHAQLWKDAVLTGERHFYGDVKLEVGDKSYESVRQYFKQRPARGTPEGDAFDLKEQERLAKQAAERPLNVARTLELLAPEERAEREEAARAAEAARVAAEAERVRQEEAERLRVRNALIRAPILNPTGEPTELEILALVNNRIGSVWDTVQHLSVAERAAFLAGTTGSSYTAEQRQAGIQAMTGELNARRVVLGRDLAARYELLGDTDSADEVRRRAENYITEGRERAQRDEARGNAGALERFERMILDGDTARAARVVDVDAIRANAKVEHARVQAEEAERSRIAAKERAAARAAADAAAAAAAETARVREAARAAVVAVTGEAPPAAPRGARVLERVASNMSMARRLPVAEREAWVRQGLDRSDQNERRAALREMSGEGARARAAFATREAEYHRSQGNTAAARSATARANRENRVATEQERVHQEAEVVATTQRVVNDALQPRAAATLAQANAYYADLDRRTGEAQRRVWNESDPVIRSQRESELNALRQERTRVSGDMVGLRRLADNRFNDANISIDRSPPEQRAAAIEAFHRKEPRMVEMARIEAEAEAAFSAKVAPDRARAAALVAAAEAANRDAYAAYLAARQRRNELRFSDAPGADEAYQRAREEVDRASSVHDEMARRADAISSLAGITRRSPEGTLTVGREAVEQKEARLAQAKRARAEFEAKVAPSRARARELKEQADRAVTEAAETADRLRGERIALANKPNASTDPRIKADIAKLDKEIEDAAAHYVEMSSSAEAISNLALITQANPGAFAPGKAAVTAKEGRIAARAAKEAAAESTFRAAIKSDVARATRLLQAQRQEESRLEDELAQHREDASRLEPESDREITPEYRAAAGRLQEGLEAWRSAKKTRQAMQRLAQGQIPRNKMAEVESVRAAMDAKESRAAERAAATAAATAAAKIQAAADAEAKAAKAAAAQAAADATARLAAARKAAKAAAPAPAPTPPARPAMRPTGRGGRPSNLRNRL